MSRKLINALIAGAVTGAVVFVAFRLIGASPEQFAGKIQNKIRRALF